jgi:hypothetical protein
MSSVDVPFSSIESVVLNKKELPDHTDIVKLSPLGMLGGGHNLLLRTREELQLKKLFGINKYFKEIVFFVDDQEGFLAELTAKIRLT